MQIAWASLLASALVAVVSAVGDLSPDSPVAVLTDSNFGEALKLMEADEERIWIVEFYAPWCAHCKKLAPIYEEAAEKEKRFRFAKIDATANKVSSSKYGIKGYPTIKWIRDGHFRPYRNGHSVTGFTGLADKLFAQPVSEISDVGSYASFDKEHDVWYLLGHTGQAEDTLKVMDAYKETARKYQDELHFGITTNNAILSQFKKGKKVAEQGVKKPFVAKVHAHGEEEPAFFSAEVAYDAFVGLESKEERVEKLSTWVYDQKLPLVSELSGMTFYDASHSGRMLCAAIVGSKEQGKEWKEGLLKLARPSSPLSQLVKDKFYFGVMDGTEERVDKFLLNYGVDVKAEDAFPRVVVFEINKRDDEKYFNEDVGELKDVPAMLEGIVAGTVVAQYEGFWGMPERWWRALKKMLPFIPFEMVEFMPRYSFIGTFGVLVIGGLLKVVCLDMEEDQDDSEEYKRIHEQIAARKRAQALAEKEAESKAD